MTNLRMHSSPPIHAAPLWAVRRSKRPSVKARAGPSTFKMPTLLESVDAIPEKYKGILLDQFGVLHDGKNAYPTAVEAVRKLSVSGRKVVILSNSARRMTNTIPRLEAMGFPGEYFAGAMTSGETTFRSLQDRPDQWWQKLGHRCIHITWRARGAVSVGGMGIEVVADVKEADFVLTHGTEVFGRGDGVDQVPASLEEIKAVLKEAAARKLPLVVANPDVVTVSGSGLIPMPGTFARWYTEFGGEVKVMGKPDPVIYIAAMELIGLEKDEVLAVGDSLEHDISGANAAGIDSMFIAGGIHATELAVTRDTLTPDANQLETLIQEHHATPTYVMPFMI